MRFVLAIASLVLAAAMIVLGIAQRTVLLGPDVRTLESSQSAGEPYTVIGGSALTSQPGNQTITVAGEDGQNVSIMYGRTADVDAWLGTSPFNQLTLNKEGDSLSSQSKTLEASPEIPATVRPEGVDAAAWANPAGSDLWLGEMTETGATFMTVSVPEDMSVLIASNGVDPAPATVSVSWPLDNSTPWADPLIIGGLILLLLGIILYLLGIRHMRKARGPRRKSLAPLPEEESSVKLPRAPKYRPEGGAAPKRRFGKRSRVALPVALVGVLALGGCAPLSDVAAGDSAVAQAAGSTASPSATPTPIPSGSEVPLNELPSPVVTVPQAERIVAKVSVTTHSADSDLDLDKLRTRFAGPALTEREVSYKIRATKPELAAATPVPGSPVKLTLPQATDAWPRTVLTIVHDKDDPSLAPTALTLVQESPRANYLVHYATRLEPSVTIPDLAPATIGAALVAPDSQFLKMAPDALGNAYGDILTNGENSEFFSMFKAEGDTLRAQIAKFREDVNASLADKAATAEFTSAPGSGRPIALASNDSGAVVSVSLKDLVKVTPSNADAKVKPSGEAVAALLGATETAKPLLTTYEDQLLFYVPAKDSDEQIVLLGFSQALIGAEEVQ